MSAKVAIVGYGTIGKRVADAVALQKDMEVAGVVKTRVTFELDIAKMRNYPIYASDQKSLSLFRGAGIEVQGKIEDLLQRADIVVDCTPKPIGAKNRETLYVPNKVKAIYQGGEKAGVAEISFVAQCNYGEAFGKDHVRVVSCNTTGLSRTLYALHEAFGIQRARATLVRRGTDPGQVKRGPINAIVPTFEFPSHHGPDVRTVIHDVEVFTTSMVVPTTIMHIHSLSVHLRKEATPKDVLGLFSQTPRVRMVRAQDNIHSTAAIMEMSRDLGNHRGDMMEICVWEEGIGTYHDEIFYMQAVHQESDVVPENIDAIRAMLKITDDPLESMKMTDESLGLKRWW
ncbi:MAG: type II glyceraldehyde-3-phosphate dehydrogenase [bacterium]